MDVSLSDVWSYVSTAVTISTLLALGLHFSEGMFVIWIPRSGDKPSKFWRFYDRLSQTADYVSGSKEKIIELMKKAGRGKNSEQ